MHKAELVNGKPVVLLNGNMVAKGFISMEQAKKFAVNLNDEGESK